ncbi:MAG: rhodanese-like domain-containing protein [Candidatus Saccharibacteria bacterium]|nr:rhodanese-like domain-containing protein [Candidatus Saccharibacteria bacterium]
MERIIIDVREPFEYEMGHVKGAINIPLSKLMSGSKKLNGNSNDTEIILYCNSGSRSGMATNILKSMGYTNVINGINKNQVIAKYN